MAGGGSVGTAYLTLVPKLQSGWQSGVNSSLSGGVDGKAAGSKAGGGFNIGFGTVIKGILGSAAVMSVVSGLRDTFSAAFDGFADSQQLLGGTRLMFGDAAEYVESRAAEAYKNVQMSANDYLTQVNGLATSLRESLGGDTQAAAELADRMVTVEADVVAAMGISAESAQNAVNGIMRGNYTMLDNLGLGIKGTKEGMQEVIDAANEWNAAQGRATNYSIENTADAMNALADYAEMMGIAGYAGKEGADTLSGSIAAMQGAWSNFLVGLATDGADVDALLQDVFTTVGNAAKNAIPVILNIAGSSAGLVGRGIMNAIGIAMSEGFPEAFKDTVMGALESVGLGDFAERFADTFESMGSYIQTFAGVISSALSLVGSFIGLVDGIVQALGLGSSAFELVSNVVGGVFTAAMNNAQTVLAGVRGALDIASSAIEYFKGLFTGEITFPHIKLPHFRINGGELPWGIGGQGTPPSVNVDWYKTGGIATDPSVVGIGEAGNEAIVPLEGQYMQPFADAIADNMDMSEMVDELRKIRELMMTIGVFIDKKALVGAIMAEVDSQLAKREAMRSRMVSVTR